MIYLTKAYITLLLFYASYYFRMQYILRERRRSRGIQHFTRLDEISDAIISLFESRDYAFTHAHQPDEEEPDGRRGHALSSTHTEMHCDDTDAGHIHNTRRKHNIV